MKRMKSLICIVMSFAMLLSVLPLAVYSESNGVSSAPEVLFEIEEADRLYRESLDSVRKAFIDRKDSVVAYEDGIKVNVVTAPAVIYVPVELFTWEELYDNATAIITSFLFDILNHTGDPFGGDYLNYNRSGELKADNILLEYDGEGDYYFIDVDFISSFFTDSTQESAVNKAVEEILETIKADKLIFEEDKIKAVYDWITANVEYDYSGNEMKHSTYNAVIEKKCVCQGYSTLFYNMMLRLGIDCRVVTGDAGKSVEDFERHGWNIVEVDGVYYQVDATWDASYTDDYQYFMKKWNNYTYHYADDDFMCAPFLSEYNLAANNYSYSCGMENSWLDYCSKSFEGKGTENDPYFLSTPADFAAISKIAYRNKSGYVDAYYDVTLGECSFSEHNWYPIGDKFTGHINLVGNIIGIADGTALFNDVKRSCFTMNGFFGDEEFVSDAVNHTVIDTEKGKKCSHCGLLIPSGLAVKIDTVSVTVGSDLSINCFTDAEIPAGYDIIARFVKEGKSTDICIDENGTFVFGGINPQCMTDEYDIFLIQKEGHEEIVLDEKDAVSIKKYCELLYADYETKTDAKSVALKRLVADMLEYGAQAQKYSGYRKDKIVSNDWEKTDFEVSSLGLVSKKNVVAEASDTANKVTGVGLILSDYSYVFFNVNMNGNTKIRLYRNGELLDSGRYSVEAVKNGYTVTTDGLKATEHDTCFRLDLVSGDVVLNSVEYSANSYVVSRCGSNEKYGDTTLGEFIRAFYNYGYSAVNYAGQKG